MTAARSPAARTTARGAPADPCAAIRAHLQTVRARIFEQVRSYPPPITACDAQFNHLLEERERIAAELRRLDALIGAAPAGGVPAAALAAFVRTSPYCDGAAALGPGDTAGA
jgi:transposase